MKKPAPLLLLLSLLTLFSCEQDLYEKGDNEYSYMRADFVEAVVGSDKQVVYVVTDNDERLLLTAPYTDSWIGRSDTVYRAILYYSNQDDRAKVELMGRVSGTGNRLGQFQQEIPELRTGAEDGCRR